MISNQCVLGGVFRAPPAGKLRRFPDARAEDADGLQQRAAAGLLNLRHVGADVGVAVGVRRDGLPVAEQPPPRAREHVVHQPLRVERIPEAVVVDDAGDVGPRGEHRLQRPLDVLLHRPPVDLVLHPRGERHLLERPDEVPVLGPRRRVADDLDVARIAAAEPEVVRHPDELDRQRIEAHELGRDGVDRDLVGARQDHVLGVRDHAARARPVAGERPVHHREHAAVNLLLDHQQVHERLVDHRMRPVPVLVQQPAERVLHRPRRRREDVGLHRRQVDDVLPDEALRNHEALRVDLVEAGELLRQIADRVADVDPLLGFVDVDVPQPVRVDDVDLLVLALAEVRVDDDRAVVAGVNQRRIVPVLLQRADDAVELPGRRRAPGKEEVPGDVDLERGVGVLRDDVLVAREVHHRVVVANAPWPASCGGLRLWISP